MDFFETVRKRRSIRAFTGQPVEDEKLQQILRSANAAPSAGNLQAYEIYVVKSDQGRFALAAAASGQDFIRTAPVVLVFCSHAARAGGKYGERGRRLYSLQDPAIACTFAMLAITALGLATVWVGAFRDELVWEAIGSPEGITPVAMLPVGYAGEEPEESSRRPLEDLVHRV